MLSRMYLLAGALCVSSYALAASPSIGSVTARGETKIDSYEVRGSGTVFEGSVVETGQSISSGADVRLAGHADITLLRDSRGTLYHDHFVLQRGTAELGLTNLFHAQANGLVILSTGAHSSGIISIDPEHSVTVEAKEGAFEVSNSSGANVARVRPGHPLSFSSATGKSPGELIREYSIGELGPMATRPNTTRVCPPNPLEDCCPGIPYPKCCNPLTPQQCGHSQ
jgi:hypothetical protein